MNNKIGLVAKHEFSSTLKRRSALFAIFGLPMLSLIILSGVNWLARSQGENTGSSALESFVSDAPETPLPAGLVDETGQLTLFPPPTDTLFALYPDLAAAEAAYEAEQINSYYRIPADYLAAGELFHYADNAPLDSFERYQLYALLTANFVGETAETGLIIAPLQLYEEIDLSAAESQSGQNFLASLALAMSIAILFYLTVMGASGYLLQSLGKEKENRVMEILLSSVRPLHLLIGKVAGLGGIGLLQMGVWSFLAFVIFQRDGSMFGNIAMPTLTAGVWTLTVLHFIAGYLVYASLFAALGAIAPNVKEGSQYTFLLMLPTFLPMWFNAIMLSAPNGPFATWLSIIPLTAPLAMPMRLTATAVPAWQWAASLAVSLGTAVLLLWAATKFFRSQTLLTGQRFSPKVIWRTLRGA